MSLIKKTPRVIKPPFGQARLKQGHPLNQGLVGWWLMNEGGGLKAYDLSGKGNHGTLTNGPTWTTGKRGPAISFDGTNNYINLGTAVGPAAGSFSVSFWERGDFPFGKRFTPFISNRLSSSPHSGFVITQDYSAPTGYLRFQLNDASAPHDFNFGTINVLDNKWHHIVLSVNRSSNRASIFVDSRVDIADLDISAVSGTIASTNPVEIGHDFYSDVYGADYFLGSIDDVRIYNRALSAGEIQSLYSDSLAALEPLPSIIWAPSAGAPATATNRQYSFVTG